MGGGILAVKELVLSLNETFLFRILSLLERVNLKDIRWSGDGWDTNHCK